MRSRFYNKGGSPVRNWKQSRIKMPMLALMIRPRSTVRVTRSYLINRHGINLGDLTTLIVRSLGRYRRYARTRPRNDIRSLDDEVPAPVIPSGCSPAESLFFVSRAAFNPFRPDVELLSRDSDSLKTRSDRHHTAATTEVIVDSCMKSSLKRHFK